MAAMNPEAQGGGWLAEAALDEFASMAETSPGEFDERFDALEVMQRVQLRRFLFERHKDGFGLPPRFVARPLDGPIEEASDDSGNGDGASAAASSDVAVAEEAPAEA